MQHSGPAIEQMLVRSLKPYPRNVRRHSKAPIKQIAASTLALASTIRSLQLATARSLPGMEGSPRPSFFGLAIVPTLRLSHLSEAERALMGSQTTSWRSTPAGTAKCLRLNCRT